MGCDFCDERLGKNTIYNKIYGIKNRTVFETENYWVFPSIGQIREGHLLIATKKHVNSIGHLNKPLTDELNNLILMLHDFYEKMYGLDMMCFEHGVLNDDGNQGGCGIYHMHLHLLPIKDDEFFSVLERLKNEEINIVTQTEGIEETHTCVRLQQTYVYVAYMDKEGNQNAFIITRKSNAFESQYMRKVVSNVLGNNEWDWRSNTNQEEIAFLETVKKSSSYFRLI